MTKELITPPLKIHSADEALAIVINTIMKNGELVVDEKSR